MLRNDPIPVIGLFDFNKSERQSVNQQGNVRPKLILAVSVGPFSDTMVCIWTFILQVDNAQAVDAVQENFTKCPPQIAVGQLDCKLLKEPVNFLFRQITSIDSVYPGPKQ